MDKDKSEELVDTEEQDKAEEKDKAEEEDKDIKLTIFEEWIINEYTPLSKEEEWKSPHEVDEDNPQVMAYASELLNIVDEDETVEKSVQSFRDKFKALSDPNEIMLQLESESNSFTWNDCMDILLNKPINTKVVQFCFRNVYQNL